MLTVRRCFYTFEREELRVDGLGCWAYVPEAGRTELFEEGLLAWGTCRK